MLFESKAKADNFLRYNREIILEENGKAPIRSYYCEFCCGYHVTSNPSPFDGERLDQRDNNLMEKISYVKQNRKKVWESLNQSAGKIKALITIGKITEAEDLLEICVLDIHENASIADNGILDLLPKLNNKISKLKKSLNMVKEMLALSGNEQIEFISNHSKEEQSILKNSLFNVLTIQMIDAMMSDNEVALQENNPEYVAARIIKCRQELNNIKGNGKKIICPKYNTLLDEQESWLNRITNSDPSKLVAKTNDTLINQDSSMNEINIDDEEYRLTLLSIIERLDNIRADFEKEDYDSCETSIEICYFILEKFGVTNDDTRLIKQNLDHWSEILKNYIE